MRYICDPHIIPACIPEDVVHLQACIETVAGYANWLHVDIDDGKFVGETSWPFRLPAHIAELSSFKTTVHIPEGLSLEVHLMTRTPRALVESFACAGFKRIMLHREAFDDFENVRAALAALKAAGAEEAGLSLKIETPLSVLEDSIDSCDFVHLMSIADIGSQGHAFDERILSRVEDLHARYPELMVSVDGGVSEATIEDLVRAGANRLIVGHALMESASPAKTYASMLERALRGCIPASHAQEPVN